MARNAPAGGGHRVGMVRKRSQIRTPLTGKETKRNRTTGKFMDQKADLDRFKGVRREKPSE